MINLELSFYTAGVKGTPLANFFDAIEKSSETNE